MSFYPSSILNLIRNISRLPGIGEKTAERLAMHILRAPRREAEQLARSILEMKDKTKLCSTCYALSDSHICSICSDQTRSAAILCVVEQPADMVAIEKSGSYKGLYHILQGVLSPMNGVGPDKIRIKELVLRIEKNMVKEVVLATGTNVEGEATASYIAQLLNKYPVKITRIASGVPMGGDLKYVDQVTLKRAMETRHAVDF
ncbi:MAG: recombination protein RecR [Desulfobacterales bacterium]|uniref:Recombination protein RecR n=1 Tax=Candidatus Desulfaltia bathyphila TaxID=2841697 RepID=A0A8J6N3I9_9BACT|nr:recombination protein RecR [Candidatus Desulfaltia bathyphila]MBL7195526.1 recombination protein RecR [Desulfobacterales bacterium]MBL7207386.1 recombination protein RecR [Desulfobacterales bacterium]